MRRLPLLALVACHTVATDRRDTGVPEASVKPEPVVVVDAAAPPKVEEALAWGTRPAMEGPLYPVVDGMCNAGEIWPVGSSALYTYGHGTFARLTDDGIEPDVTKNANPKEQDGVGGYVPRRVLGTWPGPIVLHGWTRGGGRMRSFEGIWRHDEGGWTLLGSFAEKDEPDYSLPVVHGGSVISVRSPVKEGSDEFGQPVLKTWPLEEGAKPIPGLASLGRAGLWINTLLATDTALYAYGVERKGGEADVGKEPRTVLRTLVNGKVTETADMIGAIIGATPTAIYGLNNGKLVKVEDGKLSGPIATVKIPNGGTITGRGIAPNGDVWILMSTNVLHVVHGGEVTQTTLPTPTTQRPKENVVRVPISGGTLAGVEVDDPYAIGEGGSLFHHVDGAWQEVPLPPPPFATIGKYKAQTVHVPAKGDVYVNAAYVEKGAGWKRPVGFRAVLRTKRPREVLRCNEPADELSPRASGNGFMSFPPIAGDACTTPFVILNRIGYHVHSAYPQLSGDPKSDYPSIRGVIKGMESLGTTVELVELVSGEQRYVGARVTSVAAGRELAEAVAKKVKAEYIETRPEVVCGTPKAERVVRVDVATGKAIAADAAP